MTVLKPYNVRKELEIFRSLQARMEFSTELEQKYHNLEQGHEGEKKFASIVNAIEKDWIILYDLLLEEHGSLFQIDALLITHHTIYLYDPKNYGGEFYIEGTDWYTTGKTKISHPIDQLDRCLLLFERYLHRNGVTIPVKGSVVFVNPEFTLFQAPLNLPIILPTQLNRFQQKLRDIPSQTQTFHWNLAQKLVNDHIEDSPYSRLPVYDFNGLRKGIVCSSCRSLSTNMVDKKVICRNCQNIETIDSAVLRSIKEFHLLFPNEKIQTNTIHEWCNIIQSKKTIRRILKQNLIQQGHGQHTYYVNKNK